MIAKTLRSIPQFLRVFNHINNKREFAFSFNVSDRCPVGCMCYWRAQERVKELNDDEMIKFFEARNAEGKVLAILVGGEPYVRRDLLHRLVTILPSSWIVTSATTPLLNLQNTTHFVSVDGADAATHDRVRRMPGLYNRILKNLTGVRLKGEFTCRIHSVLNKLNFERIGDMVETWKTNGLADGIVFSTMTPIRGGGEDEFQLSESEREWIVEELLKLKKVHGGFIFMTEKMISRLHPDHTRHQTPLTCGTAKYSVSYDASGKRMAQCILSDKADCTACGCVVTSFMDTLSEFDPRTIALGLKMYLPN